MTDTARALIEQARQQVETVHALMGHVSATGATWLGDTLTPEEQVRMAMADLARELRAAELLCRRAWRELNRETRGEGATLMDLSEARELADRLRAQMDPFCARIEIAGSIRREKPECRDIELVAIPRWGETQDPASLFAEPVTLNLLHRWAMKQREVQWIKPGTPDILPWVIGPKGKYWRGLLAGGVKLDLFLTDETGFGLIYLIRTGSAQFSQAVVSQGLRIGRRVVDGKLRNGSDAMTPVIPTPEETDVFRALNLAWVEPRDRADGSVLRAA